MLIDSLLNSRPSHAQLKTIVFLIAVFYDKYTSLSKCQIFLSALCNYLSSQTDREEWNRSDYVDFTSLPIEQLYFSRPSCVYVLDPL